MFRNRFIPEQGRRSWQPLSEGDRESGRPVSLLETIDDLIYHMSGVRTLFVMLSATSLILAPIAIIVAAFFLLHPGFLRLLLLRDPFVGSVFLLYVALTAVLSAVWLVVGWREHRFLSRWNDRFKRFVSLKEQIDQELGAETP